MKEEAKKAEEPKPEAAGAAGAATTITAAKPAEKKTKERQVGKFTRGDHTVHILLQKGKKFIPECKDDR